MKMPKRFATLLTVMQFAILWGQQGDNRALVRSGNEFYIDSMFSEAETDYRSAIKSNSTDPVARFNLGNALLRERNPKDAADQYAGVLKLTKKTLYLAKAYYNLGFIFQSQQQYGEAISNYENALRNNPHDNESRYNLALCRHLLKNQNNSHNKQDNQGQKEKRDDKQQGKAQQSEESKQNQKQPQEDKMSKENAERLLDISKHEEQRIQQKIRKGQRYATPHGSDKNW